MTPITRRAALGGGLSGAAALALGGCVSGAPPAGSTVARAMAPTAEPIASFEPTAAAAQMYGPVADRYPIPAAPLSRINPALLRTSVAYASAEPPGTIVIDPRGRYLYHVQGGGRAMRYGVGVGREGFAWSGVATIHDKQEWPDWFPPKEMVQRQPELRKRLGNLQGGLGMPGGPGNPLGARALYLYDGNRDTMFRIHGTNEPWSIGGNVSSGCIRMLNAHVTELARMVTVGTKVIVM